jgi:PAS domain S-box-containing protein
MKHPQGPPPSAQVPESSPQPETFPENKSQGNQAQNLLRVLMDGVPDAVFMLDSGGNVASWNAGAARMKQYSADEIVGKHFSIFYPAEEVAAGSPERALKTAALKGSFEEQGWRIRKDKSSFWASAIVTALRDPDGSVIGFSKITRDLSELKAAQEAIERSDARFSGIVKISEDAIISIDEKQSITLFNDGAEKIFGYSSQEILGHNIGALIPSRFLGAHDSYIKNLGASTDSLRAMNARDPIDWLRQG